MARTIESPGVQINEIDLSLTASLPVGTNILVNGFADSGPTQELLHVTSIGEYEQVYGKPTNSAERYAYHTMNQLLATPGKVLFNRLPYGDEGGSGFNDDYTALLYPIYSIARDEEGSIVSGYENGMVYDTAILENEEVTYVIGAPTQKTITEETYYSWKAGEVAWGTESAGMVDFTELTESGAGIIVVNKLKTSVNPDFEGYYLGITDNYKASTTTTVADFTFDTIQKIVTSKNAVNGITTPLTWATLSEARINFKLVGDLTTTGSLSETLESIPTWDIGDQAYNDSLIFGVYKFRRSASAPKENALDFVRYEGFVGALGDDRKYTPPNSFQEETYNLEKIANESSAYLDVLINPNISKGTWLDDSGVPNKKVRILSTQYITDDLDIPTPSALATQTLDGVVTLGEYKEKEEANKVIGNVPAKLTLGLRLAEDYQRHPLDIVLDGGLSTIHTAMSLAPTGELVYNDSAAIKGIFNNDIIEDKPGLLDQVDGESSLAQRSWQTIFNLFDKFCQETRKDCMFVADCLRHQLVSGKNLKVLDNKTNNFSQHVYTPLRNLVTKSNSNYSAVFAQWSQVYDSNSGDFAWVPFSGFQGAIMAKLDARHYPWFAPAGLENGIVTGVTDIAIGSTQKQRDLMYRHNLNAIVFFPNDGIVTWGQKTLQKKPSAFDRINVRRLFLVLEKATRDIMKYFVFQPNTVFTRARVVNVLTPIFDVAKNNEGVYDYLIVCDERNNTPHVIDNNELRVSIYLKPVRAAEFILVDFYATRTDQDFNELI